MNWVSRASICSAVAVWGAAAVSGCGPHPAAIPDGSNSPTAISPALASRPRAREHLISCHYADARVPSQAWLYGIGVVGVHGTSCKEGARVLRRVASDLRVSDYRHLGLKQSHAVDGYGCRAWLTGDSAWRIHCHRTGRAVAGFTAN